MADFLGPTNYIKHIQNVLLSQDDDKITMNWSSRQKKYMIPINNRNIFIYRPEHSMHIDAEKEDN